MSPDGRHFACNEFAIIQRPHPNRQIDTFGNDVDPLLGQAKFHLERRIALDQPRWPWGNDILAKRRGCRERNPTRDHMLALRYDRCRRLGRFDPRFCQIVVP